MNPTSLSTIRETIQTYLIARLPDPKGATRPELAQYAQMLRDYPARGGKGLRGILLALTGLAFGQTEDRLIPTAAALELFQNWALIHDDIEDESDERRGKPALHKIYGMPLALNAGDALHARMWALLIEAGVPHTVLGEFVGLVERTAEGQHLEMVWMADARFDLREEDYLEMVGKKAAYYTAVAPLKLGAMLANHEPPEAFERAGIKLGIGFQIIDDVLNLNGDPALYGKEIAGDIWEGKRTLILINFLGRCSAIERLRVQALLKTPRTKKDPQEVNWVHQRLLESGSVEYAEHFAQQLLHDGLEILTPVFSQTPNPKAGAMVMDVLEGLVNRRS